jgi:hypothetical protein
VASTAERRSALGGMLAAMAYLVNVDEPDGNKLTIDLNAVVAIRISRGDCVIHTTAGALNVADAVGESIKRSWLSLSNNGVSAPRP